MSVVDTRAIEPLVRAQRIPNDATAATLAERKAMHGDFTDHAAYAQRLKLVALSSNNWRSGALSLIQREAIDMILHKIARILAGDPNHTDHWRDIAGYARLVEERLP